MSRPKKFVFAIPSTECGYFTKGKQYMVVSEDQYGFQTFDNEKVLTYCTWTNSSHMFGGGFERQERTV